MTAPLDPLRLAASLTELWSPRIIARIGDCAVKIARIHGGFVRHTHEAEDELFWVLSGTLRIEFDDGAVEIGAGQLYVVPKGVPHRPVAQEEVLLALVEPMSTAHTGETVSAITRTIEDQLRPLRPE